MAQVFKDFIPEGEEQGAQGHGFKDFVPPVEPKPVVEETPVVPEPVVEEPVEKPKKKGWRK